MPELKTREERGEYILDKVTIKIVDTLLDNPSIPYNKNQLAKASDVSRDALYRRCASLEKHGIVKKADVGSKGSYWELNEESETVEAIAKILHA